MHMKGSEGLGTGQGGGCGVVSHSLDPRALKSQTPQEGSQALPREIGLVVPVSLSQA